ncbi:MAG: TSUP family transporter [Gaiellaceae bacterium]
MGRRRTLARLAVIAILAGAFSGLFGVGGGGIMVPLLVLWLGFEEREATGTSLAAIVGTWQQRRYGNLRPREAVVIGVLALPGVLIGAGLANVLPERALAIAFAFVLVVFGLRMARRALGRV